MSRLRTSGLVQSVQDRLRNEARIPAGALEGLADSFASEPLHAGRWPAFLAKNRLPVTEAHLAGVVASIRGFAQPVLDAAREGRPFRQHWPRGGPWQAGEERGGRSHG